MILRRLSTLSLLAAAACAASPETSYSITDVPPLPPSAFAEEERDLSPEKLREDLTALYEGLKSAHYDLYARQSSAAYDALYNALLDELDQPLKPSEAVFIFQRFAAFGNVAHARLDGTSEVWARYRAAGGKAVPIYPRIRGERAYVAESYAPGIEPGDEILTIDGTPTADWLTRLYRNTSGDTDYIKATLVELSFPLDIWTEVGPVETLTLTLRALSGETRTVSVETIDSETLADRAEETANGFFVLDGTGRKADMLEGGIAYLQPGPFYGIETPENMWDTAAFEAFIDESFRTFLANDAQALIVDLRLNPGGDSSFSDQMIAWFADEPFRFASEFLIRSSPESQASNQARIEMNPASADGASGVFASAYADTPFGETFPFSIPFSKPREGERFEGPVYAIVDRYSYSNAVNVAALLQDYGFATILGEETADLPTTYGAMETFDLPNSGLTVGYPKALIVRASGEITDRGVQPDVVIETPVFSQTDVVLDKVLEFVRRDIDEAAPITNSNSEESTVAPD